MVEAALRAREVEVFESVVDLLEARCQAGDRLLYTFLADGEREEGRLDRATLHRRALGIAAALDARPGERALLLYPPGLEFITAFFACLAAGVVAVPAFPPASRRALPRLAAIARDAEPSLVLTTQATMERYRQVSASVPELIAPRWLTTDDLGDRGASAELPTVSGDDLAFLQYTSGSTAAPKGVRVSHRNLLANEAMIRRAFDQGPESVVVGWLPLYHDMGLIGNVLQPLFCDGSCVLMAPVSFLQRPLRWLQAIHKYRATTSGGPNFAYDLCVRRIDAAERAELDLSSWRIAYNGSEPVRADTLERFVEAFGPSGFDRRAFFPCYGLAEATLYVSGSSPEEEPQHTRVSAAALEENRAEAPRDDEDSRTLASSGRPDPDMRLLVVEPESGQPLPEGGVGELWLAGENVAGGYWNQPEATHRDFEAQAPGHDGTFLRTGDLGFLRDGELYVTGRLKDLIIVRGRNHYPQDLEHTAGSAHPALVRGSCAAFTLEPEAAGDGERLVLALEVERRQVRALARDGAAEVAEAVRRGVAEGHEIVVHDVVLLKTGTLPKTSSGKIMRHAARKGYLEGSLADIARDVLPTAVDGAEHAVSWRREDLLAIPEAERSAVLRASLGRRLAALLGLAGQELPTDRALTALGLDSLRAMELLGRLEEDLGVAPDVSLLLGGATLDDLTVYLLDGIEVGGTDEFDGFEISLESEEGDHPLSPGQQALWFLDRLAPGQSAYNLAVPLRLAGSLDEDALERAAERLADRHSALRTHFPAPGGAPVQRIRPAEEVGLAPRVEDALGWTAEQLGERLEELAESPFDLALGPLGRLHLLRHGAENHTLLVVVHHTVADFRSLVILLEDLGTLYADEVSSGSPEFAALARIPRYVDHVRWQAQRLAGSRGRALEAFWEKTLEGAPPALELPADRARPPVQTFTGGTVGCTLDGTARGTLEALAARHGVTFFTLLAAAFHALLHRWSGQPRVLLGTPDTGRPARALGRVVGFFVNPIVLSSELRGNTSFQELLATEQGTVLGALAHRDQPFEKLVERLQPERDVSRSPLFQVMLSWQSLPHAEREALGALALGRAGSDFDLGGLEATPVALHRRSATFDLELVAAPVPEGLGFRLVYNTDLFDRTTMTRLLGHLTTLLRDAAEQPHAPVHSLAWTTPAERHQALVAGNDSARPIPDLDLFRLVAQAAEGRHESVAVAGLDPSSTQLSYGELLRRASRLAYHLEEAGAGPETPVAVCLERCPQMVEGLLAVLGTGAFYVPLDPTYPAARLESMLQDTYASSNTPGHRLLLSQNGLLPQLGMLPELAGRILLVDAAWPEAEAWEPKAIPPEQLAYVIYTSGSTGRPKGVQVNHRGVVNFLRAVEERLELDPGDRLLAVTTLAFDIAVLEIFLPLLTGGRVILADSATTASGSALGQALERTGATVMQATPASWRLMLESGWSGESGFVAASGGEALPPELATRILKGGARLWNLYGPTETTIWSAASEVTVPAAEAGVARGDGAMGLGSPLDNNRLYLLDAQLLPVPVGLPGEVYIAGDGLARGYLGRPALTAERFVPDALTPGARGARLYRVGDLARRLGDASLHFLGRVDHQVKVRGYRIELGEIEAVLGGLEGVARTAVVVREERRGDPRLVAWVVPEPGATGGDVDAWHRTLREALRAHLPEYMVPSLFLHIDELPLTPNGKVDRRRLPDPPRRVRDSAGATPTQGLEPALAELWREVLDLESVGRDDNFFDLGGHSLLVARLEHRIAERFGRDDLSVVDLFRHPTIAAQARFLENKVAPETAPAAPLANTEEETEIAVIGLSLRMPGANTPEELWQNLRDGVESITFFSREELEGRVDPALLNDPAYVRARGVVQNAAHFDASFFGFPPREAEILDPQHRIFLEGAWQALEDAGYPPGAGDRVGVFAGVGLNTYLLHVGEALLSQAAGDYQAFVSNDKDFVPTRVSYKLDLRGPSVNVQTACSSSLVAVHLACQSLLRGEAEMALAGGVTVRSPQEEGYRYQPGAILSDDGHCRAFDARGGGTVVGSGMGIVVLKPLARALADGDRVRAVIKGTAINNDGGHKVGYTAPGLEGQVEVLRSALAAARVEPETVTLVEAHGTGTSLGDPIEAAALAEVFGERPDGPALDVGSIKTNIGHLDTAAGVAGLIKAVLALEHGQIPPSLHFDTLNPKIDWSRSPLRVADRLRPWQVPEGTPRRAGVSSFGIGGTNAHVVLEQAPELVPEAPETEQPPHLLVLSARSDAALDHATERLADTLRNQPELPLRDVAFTLQGGRKRFDHRRFLLASSAEEALDLLGRPETLRTLRQSAEERPVVFLFPGQGSQYPGMARQLYSRYDVFRQALDRCATHLEASLGLDLRTLLWPDGDDTEASERLRQTRFTQPALFAVEYALAQLLISWGLHPQAMIGHSVGEYVAACLAGVFQLEDALDLIATRGRLIQALPGGRMLAVGLSRQEVEALDAGHLSLAAVNGPRDVVVSGSSEEIAAFEAELVAKGVRCRALHTSHAFHSSMVRPAVAPLVAAVAAVERKAPKIPYLSNVTGTWIDAQEATDPVYWGRHMAGTTDFAAGAKALLQDPNTVFLEVGPGNGLGNLLRQQSKDRLILPCLRHPKETEADVPFLLTTVGRLWLAGADLHWPALHQPHTPQRVSLPTYPFERRRYWLEGSGQAKGLGGNPLAVKADPQRWLYTPVWSQHPAAPGPPEEIPRWVFCTKPDEPWVDALSVTGPLTTVVPGESFARLGPHAFTVNPTSAEDFTALFDAVDEPPGEILHGWLLGSAEDALEAQVDTGRQLGCGALVALASALAPRDFKHDKGPGLTLLTDRLYSVYGGETLRPAAALAAGLLLPLGQEHRQLEVRHLDLDLGHDPQATGLAELLRHPASDAPLALRFGRPWSLGHQALEVPTAAPFSFADDDAVVITGGLGGVGLALAEGLVEQGCTRLALLGRRPLPSRGNWSDPTLDTTDAQRIAAVRRLEELGAQVLPLAADVTQSDAMAGALAEARETLGPLRGVIHAAGLAGGGLLATRPSEAIDAVLAPKVAGTLVLLELMENLDPAPDFLAFCSSVNAVVGGYGQADYCAANAFLDAIAHAHSRPGGPRILSVDWDRWQDTGMAANGGQSLEFKTPDDAPVLHPLLGRRIEDEPGRVVYRSELRAEEQWVLHEHVVADRPTVPGATYLEMARVALSTDESQALAIESVVFLRPLAMADDGAREVLTVLETDGGNGSGEPHHQLRVLSRDLAHPGSWDEHVNARLRTVEAEVPEAVDLPSLRQRLNRPVEGAREVAASDTFLRTGSRWQSLRNLYGDEGELLAEIELPAESAEDAATFALHPAMLDIATGCIRLTRKESYLPLTYDALTLHAPLPPRVWSWVQERSQTEAEDDVLRADVHLLDDQGQVCAVVEGFAMRRIHAAALAALRAGATSDVSTEAAPAQTTDPIARELLRGVIAPEAGRAILAQVLGAPTPPQLVVSPRDLDAVAGLYRDFDPTRTPEAPQLPTSVHERPRLDTAYVAPGEGLERQLAAIWQRFLGLEKVGIHDNFFELGGTSLLGVQVVAEIGQALGREVPTVSLFEAPTVASLARYLAPKEDAEPAFAKTRSRIHKKKSALAHRRPRRRRGGPKSRGAKESTR